MQVQLLIDKFSFQCLSFTKLRELLDSLLVDCRIDAAQFERMMS